MTMTARLHLSSRRLIAIAGILGALGGLAWVLLTAGSSPSPGQDLLARPGTGADVDAYGKQVVRIGGSIARSYGSLAALSAEAHAVVLAKVMNVASSKYQEDSSLVVSTVRLVTVAVYKGDESTLGMEFALDQLGGENDDTVWISEEDRL